MRYANFNINIFELVKQEGFERYLYLTQKELLEKNRKLIKKLLNTGNISHIGTQIQRR